MTKLICRGNAGSAITQKALLPPAGVATTEWTLLAAHRPHTRASKSARTASNAAVTKEQR
jgi:hypothetical protein